jgi:hypothetical protein
MITFNPYLQTAILPQGIQATGGTIQDITVGGVNYRTHTFTTSGTFTVTSGGELDYLVVAGGGGAGQRLQTGNNSGFPGGGGAGGLLTSFLTAPTTITNGSYPITVGLGGLGVSNSADNRGANGQNSTALGLTAIGGGGGGSGKDGVLNETTINGSAGGSGGGAGGSSQTTGTGNGGAGTAGQGRDGRAAVPSSGAYPNNSRSGGPGGGATAQGPNPNGTSTDIPKNGGAGRNLSAFLGTGFGDNGSFAGGGAAGQGINVAATSRIAGGGFGTTNAQVDGLPNTGGGGGGRDDGGGGRGGNGGSGVVIIRYAI